MSDAFHKTIIAAGIDESDVHYVSAALEKFLCSSEQIDNVKFHARRKLYSIFLGTNPVGRVELESNPATAAQNAANLLDRLPDSELIKFSREMQGGMYLLTFTFRTSLKF